MQVADAIISGSLGQAIFFVDGAWRILDAPGAEPRLALHNEIRLFCHSARESSFAHPERQSVPIDRVRERLDQEVRFFAALDGLLIGMDRDFSDKVRRRSIVRADRMLSKDKDLAPKVRDRFFIPANTQEWDAEGALAYASEVGAELAYSFYMPIANGLIDLLADDIAIVTIEKVGVGLDAAQQRETILRSGLLAELALIVGRGDQKALSTLLFRRKDFPKLISADPSGQILAGVVRRIKNRLGAEHVSPVKDDALQVSIFDETAPPSTVDPIIQAVERAPDIWRRRRSKSTIGNAGDLPSIRREIDWIGKRLVSGQADRAERALIKLVDRQAQRSRPEDIVKTLTAVADFARRTRQIDLAVRILSAIDHTDVLDAAAMNVRAETLHDLGRHDEALRVFEETMQRFPQDEVAPTAYAETLRDLGHRDEALRVFEETMQRFPQNAVTRNAYAETLRDLGRRDEALRVFEETMQRIPQDEVARNAYAEILRDLGRRDEALRVFEETMQLFPQDEVAPTAYAETLRDLGRRDEALRVFEETMQRFPYNAVAPSAYAETLRDLGRRDEALRVFEETMQRFPQDEVAPTAYAETLRDLGRRDEALRVFEETMQRFPHNPVAPTAYAETLRDLGRRDEALRVFEETIQRFPQNEVTRNAYAETLREFGRRDEALRVFEETMQRFPQSEVARTAYAHLLAQLGRLGQAEEILSAIVQRPQTRSNWIAVHVLAMAKLRSGQIDEALSDFERGIKSCEFLDSRRFFLSGRSLALLAAKRAADAVEQLKALAKDPSLNQEETTNVILFEAHALAELGRPQSAKSLIESAHVIDFAAAKQQRLARALSERYGLGIKATRPFDQLSNEIAELEYELARPRIVNDHMRRRRVA